MITTTTMIPTIRRKGVLSSFFIRAVPDVGWSTGAASRSSEVLNAEKGRVAAHRRSPSISVVVNCSDGARKRTVRPCRATSIWVAGLPSGRLESGWMRRPCTPCHARVRGGVSSLAVTVIPGGPTASSIPGTLARPLEAIPTRVTPVNARDGNAYPCSSPPPVRSVIDPPTGPRRS